MNYINALNYCNVAVHYGTGFIIVVIAIIVTLAIITTIIITIIVVTSLAPARPFPSAPPRPLHHM